MRIRPRKSAPKSQTEGVFVDPDNIDYAAWAQTDIERKYVEAGFGFGICGVYGLVYPHEDHIVYIGQSTSIICRYGQHCDLRYPGGNYAVRHWLEWLVKHGAKPRLIILVRCAVDELDDHEIRLIKKYSAKGHCEFNHSSGGYNRSSRR